MKRVVVWIDVRDEDAEHVSRNLEEYLDSVKVSHRVVDVSQIRTVEDKR
jgi:hypothetical protein